MTETSAPQPKPVTITNENLKELSAPVTIPPIPGAEDCKLLLDGKEIQGVHFFSFTTKNGIFRKKCNGYLSLLWSSEKPVLNGTNLILEVGDSGRLIFRNFKVVDQEMCVSAEDPTVYTNFLWESLAP